MPEWVLCFIEFVHVAVCYVPQQHWDSQVVHQDQRELVFRLRFELPSRVPLHIAELYFAVRYLRKQHGYAADLREELTVQTRRDTGWQARLARRQSLLFGLPSAEVVRSQDLHLAC